MRTPILILLVAFATSDAVHAESIDGYWQGHVQLDGATSDVAVRIASRDGKPTGTVDWPSMGYLRADLLSIKEEDSIVTLAVPLPVGSIKLRSTPTSDTMHGTISVIGLVRGQWRDLGKQGSFVLRRANEPAIPYSIREVSFASGDVTLAGSLFLPHREEKCAGVVYIAGSGNATRGDGSFLADRLARSGIASLVYDKRGTGKSTGDWRTGGFKELAQDATASLRFLQSRPEIAAPRTGFVCQSQGCWVAPIALRSGAPARFLVAQSGPTVSVADEDLDFYRVTLSEQGFGEPEIQEAFDLIRLNQRVSLGTASWSELENALGELAEREWFKALGFEPDPVDAPIRAFDRHTLTYDPAGDLDAIRIPSLWIYGEADTIIPVQASIARIREARAQPKPEIATLPRAGHMFTVSNGSLPYVAEGYPNLVVRWIGKLRAEQRPVARSAAIP